jgi:hypothetical protein
LVALFCPSLPPCPVASFSNSLMSSPKPILIDVVALVVVCSGTSQPQYKV